MNLLKYTAEFCNNDPKLYSLKNIASEPFIVVPYATVIYCLEGRFYWARTARICPRRIYLLLV